MHRMLRQNHWKEHRKTNEKIKIKQKKHTQKKHTAMSIENKDSFINLNEFEFKNILKFKKLKELGSGTAGSVFLTLHNNKHYAIKVIYLSHFFFFCVMQFYTVFFLFFFVLSHINIFAFKSIEMFARQKKVQKKKNDKRYLQG